jgi:hypothetical protein
LRHGLDDTELAAGAAGRPDELERKLDQVLRELVELRRSLRPLTEKQPAKP